MGRCSQVTHQIFVFCLGMICDILKGSGLGSGERCGVMQVDDDVLN